MKNTSDLQTELQFILARGEIHVMTGLNKDKDKDKRSGEARVSDVLTASLSFYTLQIFVMGVAIVCDCCNYYCFMQTR